MLCELTENQLKDFISGKRDWITVTQEEFDEVDKVLQEKNIKTYSSLDADDVVIDRI